MSVLSALPVGTRSRRPVATPSTGARSKHDFGAVEVGGGVGGRDVADRVEEWVQGEDPLRARGGQGQGEGVGEARRRGSDPLVRLLLLAAGDGGGDRRRSRRPDA